LKTTVETFFESTPLAASPTLGVNFAVFGRTEELLVGVVLNRAPEKCPATCAGPTSVVDMFAGLVAADGADQRWVILLFLLIFFTFNNDVPEVTVVVHREVVESWSFDFGHD